MSDFPFSLRQFYSGGLRRTERQQGGLLTCYGLVPEGEDLRAYRRVEQLDASSSLSWPFPMVFQSENEAFLFFQRSVQSLDTSSWTGEALETYDPEHPARKKSITGSGVWHFASFWDSWFATNGTTVVFKTNIEGFHGRSNVVQAYDRSPVASLCSLPGRLVYGGFSSSTFWSSVYEHMWDRMKQSIDSDQHLSLSMPENSVAWSSIGGGDALWPILPELAIYGQDKTSDYYDWDNNKLDEMLDENLFGFMPMPWRGTVRRVIGSQNNCVVFGDNGIALLFGTEAGTFGMRKLLSLGIASRGSVAVGDMGFLFVGSDMRLYSMDREFQVQPLGYEEFIEELTADEILVSYHPEEKWFIISDSSQAFVFSNSGLGEATETVTSVIGAAGTVYGISSQKDSIFVLFTDTFNMGNSSKKRIPLMSTDYTNGSSIQARLFTRFSKGDAFTAGDLADLNQEGVSHHFITGVDFRFYLTGSVQDSFRLSNITGRWQATDSRYLRGVPSNAIAND